MRHVFKNVNRSTTWVQQEFSSLISDVLTKFKSVSGLIFRSKKEQDTAVKNLLSNRDVHAVLQPGYSKSFQMHVMARDINNMHECILVICPLTSLIKD